MIMNIHNLIMDIHNCIHNWIADIQYIVVNYVYPWVNYRYTVHNSVMDIPLVGIRSWPLISLCIYSISADTRRK